jgi:peptide/nickel transport system substrate-binding protein
MYDTLLDYDGQEGLQPNLAERWDLPADGTSLTFWLNPEARWHDGEAVTAQDVVFSFNLVLQKQFPGLMRLAALVDRAEAISPHEVRFTLLTNEADAPRWLATALCIVPEHVWEQVGDAPHEANLDHPIGSGPFSFVEFVQGQRLVLDNTRVHPSTHARVSRLVLEIVRDESKAVRALQEGQVDVLGWDIAPQWVSEAKNQAKGWEDVRWVETPGLSTHTLLLNLRKPPDDTRAFREALALAVDAPALIKDALLGFGDVAAPSLFPAFSPWANPDITALPSAPQQAIQKLNQAGFLDQTGDALREDPQGKELQIALLCPNQPTFLLVGGLIVAQWRAVGISAKLTPIAQDALLPRLMQAQFDVALHSIALDEPEMAYLYFHSSQGSVKEGHVVGLNYGGYANAEYDELASASLEEQNFDRRRQLLYRMQAILAADLPQIPLYVPRVLNLYREDRFTGWLAEPGSGLLNRTSIARVQAR